MGIPKVICNRSPSFRICPCSFQLPKPGRSQPSKSQSVIGENHRQTCQIPGRSSLDAWETRFVVPFYGSPFSQNIGNFILTQQISPPIPSAHRRSRDSLRAKLPPS